MRAVVITSPGDPDVLKLTEVPDPVPGPGEVLVDVAAAGVNRADVLQRMGFYPPPPGAPPYPGLECSGRISTLGAGVTVWQPGDEVCALLGGGGYAERVAVPQGQLLPVPEGVSLLDAAGLPETACTVYATVFQQARLTPGETILVHGGAGGIGTMAIQLAKSFGARVICTAGTPAKLERCTELGADLAVSYMRDDFVSAVDVFTGGRGADVILDIVGGPYLARNVAALATGGRLLVVSTQGGTSAELDLQMLMRKRASILASTLRARPPAEKAAIVAGVREQVWPLISAGRVQPVTDRVLPMADAAEAHRVLEQGTHVGKILLAN
jgi:putative PIG3 family NAD(P)H quinone oxidoreductase